MKHWSWNWANRVILSKWNGLRARVAGQSERRLQFYPSAWHFRRVGFPQTIAAIPSGGYLTYRPNLVAGIGHQSVGWIAAYNLAQNLGLTFVHRPIDPEWDPFLGLSIGEVTYTDPGIKMLRRVSLPSFPGEALFDLNHPIAHIVARELGKGPCLFITEYDQSLYDLSPVRHALRSKFFAAHSELSPDKIPRKKWKIALHIRRGDIIGLNDPRTDLKYVRFLPETYYIELAKTLRRSITSHPLEFHIYSDGCATDLPEISRSLPDAIWHLGVSAQETFYELCHADVLALGRSGFSFLAGLINPGIKISTTPWWHKIPETADWLQVTMSAEADTYSFQDLEEQLKFIVPRTKSRSPL